MERSDRKGQIRVLGACVAENHPHFAVRVENLLISWRTMGGRLSDAPFRVHVVDDISDDFRRRVTRLGADVRLVPRLSLDAFNLGNKLRMLEVDEADDFDVLLAIDCDVVLVGDPLEHITPGLRLRGPGRS